MEVKVTVACPLGGYWGPAVFLSSLPSCHVVTEAEYPVWWFDRKWLPKGVILLGGVALLEELWLCWKQCVIVEAGFEVSYAQAVPSEQDHFLLPSYQDVGLSASASSLPVHH